VEGRSETMNILMITENDPAGMGIAYKNAINRHTDHHCRLVTTTTRYNFAFEKDIHVPDLADGEFELIVALLRKADIIHFHILADENMMLGPICVKDYIKGKAILHHHHGHPDFRSHPEKYRDKYRKRRRKVLVSTPDLLHLVPEAEWQPNLVPIDSPYYLPVENHINGKTRICQSPTRKDLKNTREFESTVESLKKTYPYVEKIMIANSKHLDCLRIKQSCDIHFDHMHGYFGVSSLEGLSQGKPVIAGLDDWNAAHIKRFTGSATLPWVIARGEHELYDYMKKLIEDVGWRNEIGAQSRHFMEGHWSDKRVLHILLEIYGKL